MSKDRCADVEMLQIIAARRGSWHLVSRADGQTLTIAAANTAMADGARSYSIAAARLAGIGGARYFAVDFCVIDQCLQGDLQAAVIVPKAESRGEWNVSHRSHGQ